MKISPLTAVVLGAAFPRFTLGWRHLLAGFSRAPRAVLTGDRHRFLSCSTVLGLLCLLPGLARGQGDPAGCTGSGIGIALYVDKSEAHTNDVLHYTAQVLNLPSASAGNPGVCQASSVQAWVVLPNGQTNFLQLVPQTLDPGYVGPVLDGGTYTIRPQDIQSDGTVKAAAFVSGKIHQNVILSDGLARQGVNTKIYTPCISVTQQCANGTGEQGSIAFSGTVANCGNIDLTGVTVSNVVNGVAVLVLGPVDLAVGQSMPYSGQYVPANPCAPTTSTAVAQGQDILTPPKVVSASASSTCSVGLTPGIGIGHSCPAGPVSPGQPYVYSGTVTNTGNITLTNVVVVSDQPAPGTQVLGPMNLAPGQVAPFTGTFTAPLVCSITSTLTVTGRSDCGTAVTATSKQTCPIVTTPAINVVVSCPTAPVAAGSKLTYTGTVANQGTGILRGVRVVSDHPTANTPVFSIDSLAPGASTNFTGSYVTPADACSVTSTVTATGQDACSQVLVTNSASITCPLQTAAQIVITQTCPSTPPSLGAALNYSGTLHNAGTVTLSNIVVVSDHPAAGTVVFTLGSLAPGANVPFTGSFNVPADLNACSITQTLTVTAGGRCAEGQVTDSVTTTCPVVTTHKIAVTRSCPAGPVAPGATMVLGGTVTNLGNITLTNVIVVCDHPAPNTPVFGPANLAPGQGTSFTASFLVPTNVNNCSLSSTLTASGNDACTGVGVTASASGTCPVLTAPGIEVTKQCPPNAVAQGALLTFSSTVQNTGNITLTNIVVVNNQPAPNTVVFRAAALLPGQTTNFTASYTVPNNCCSVTDTLLATANDQCTGLQVSDTATAVCPVLFNPSIKVTKNCPTNAVAPGDTLTFKGTVSNTGNITLVGVMVYDDRVGTAKAVLGPIDLAPGEIVPYTGHYTVVADFCGTDTVSAQATSLCGAVQVTNSVTSTCALLTSPSLVVTKTCPTTPIVRCSPVVYSGTLFNSGNVTLTGVMVFDNQPANNTPVFGPVNLAPGFISTFSFTNSAPDSCNCCAVVDTLTATGKDACSGAQVTSTSTAVCEYQTTPALAVSMICPTSAQPGDLASYTGVVKNAGDITLTNVMVTANFPADGTSLAGPLTLAPGETEEFAGQFPVTSDHPLSGLVVSASGADTCQGRSVSTKSNCAGPVGPELAPIVGPVEISLDGVKISWVSIPGLTYRVQFKSALNASDSWHNVPGDVTALCTISSKTENGMAGYRFYRIVVVQ
jgi:uncharacterized repeat protein (TIGR01451 family)